MPALVMAIAMFMILTQLHIAPTIVIITYAAILGMLALAGALAFGLGGRDVAAKMWASAYEKGQQQAAQVKADAATGKERAQQQAQQAKEKAQAKAASSPATVSPPRPAGPAAAKVLTRLAERVVTRHDPPAPGKAWQELRSDRPAAADRTTNPSP